MIKTMNRIEIYNNLESLPSPIDEETARKTAEMIRQSIITSQERDPAYTEEQLDLLISLNDTETMKRIFNERFGLIARSDDLIIGAASLCQHDEPKSFEIKLLYVAPSSQGKGLGSKLTTRLEDQARALEGRVMYVEAALFPPSRRFYERKGYTLNHALEKDFAGSRIKCPTLSKEL